MKSEVGVVLAVIILAILSIVFGVFAYLNFKEIDPGDDPKNAMDEKIRVKREANRGLEDKIAEYRLQKEELSGNHHEAD